VVALDGTSMPVSFCTRLCEWRLLYTYHPKASLSRPNPSWLLLLMELGFVLQEALLIWSWSCCSSASRARFASPLLSRLRDGVELGIRWKNKPPRTIDDN
jgi:hypothetical protein